MDRSASERKDRHEGHGKYQGSCRISARAQQPQTGIVLAVGEGKLDKDGNKIPVPVKVGDKVIYGKYGGTEVKCDGEEVLILRSDDIYAIVE